MSYKLITRAIFAVITADGNKLETNVEVRAYAAPKRDESGKLTVDKQEGVPYKRTGGKGRGTQDHRYVYANVKGESGYFPITAAQADALPTAKSITLTSVATTEIKKDEQPKVEAKAPKQAQAPAAAQAPAEQPKKAQRKGQRAVVAA